MKSIFFLILLAFSATSQATSIDCSNPQFVQYKFLGYFQSPIDQRYSCTSSQAACVDPTLCPRTRPVSIPPDYCTEGQVVVNKSFFGIDKTHSCVSRSVGCYVASYCPQPAPPAINCPKDSQFQVGIVGYEQLPGTKYVCPRYASGCVNNSYCPTF